MRGPLLCYDYPKYTFIFYEKSLCSFNFYASKKQVELLFNSKNLQMDRGGEYLEDLHVWHYLVSYLSTFPWAKLFQ